MHFHNGNLHPGSVHFMNNRLQFTETCSLLRINVLPDFKAGINAAVQQFNVKCISMLLDFKHLLCDVLSKLIVYCLDVYGSQLWDYESGRAEVFMLPGERRCAGFGNCQMLHTALCCPLYATVTQMLEELTWVPLSKTRENARLILFYKIINNLAMVPHSCLEKADGRTRKNHNLKFRHIGYNVDPYGQSFFPKCISAWNGLAQEIAEANTLDLFKSKLAH